MSSHLPCLCECVRLIVKKAKTVGREKKREKDTHSIARMRTRPSPPAVRFACWKRNYAAKETKYKVRFISEYYVTITASYPDVSLARAKEGGKETTGRLRLPSVPFPWSLAAHHQSLASTLRKMKRLKRRLSR